MFKLTINGWTLSQWLANALRKKFAEQEVKPGRMLVIWTDIDSKVYGWTLPADQEVDLLKVAALISQVKHEKLVQTVTGEKNG